jgi:hypothetical protein
MNFWRLCLLLKMTMHSKTEMRFQVEPGNENLFLIPSSFFLLPYSFFLLPSSFFLL